MRRFVLVVAVVLFACFAAPEPADAEPGVAPPAAEVTAPGDEAPTAGISRRRHRRHRKARKARKARKHHKARAKQQR